MCNTLRHSGKYMDQLLQQSAGHAIRKARRTGTVTASLLHPCNADAPSTLHGSSCIYIYYPNDSGRRAMAPAVVTAQARVRSQASPSEICGRQCGTEIGFSPSSSVSPVGIIPPMLRIHLLLNLLTPELFL